MKTFPNGAYVHKKSRHRFQGWVVCSGTSRAGDKVVTVEHYPEGWVFHFREEQLKLAPEETMDRPHAEISQDRFARFAGPIDFKGPAVERDKLVREKPYEGPGD